MFIRNRLFPRGLHNLYPSTYVWCHYFSRTCKIPYLFLFFLVSSNQPYNHPYLQLRHNIFIYFYLTEIRIIFCIGIRKSNAGIES